MKTLPPIPPNNPRFRDDILYSGRIYYLCPGPGTRLIHLNGDRDEIPVEWVPVIASDAEVSWRKRADYLRGLALGRTTGDSHHAIKCARAWRSWAEPESEEADNA